MTARRFCASEVIYRERCEPFSGSIPDRWVMERMPRGTALAVDEARSTDRARGERSEQERGEQRCIGSLRDGR